MKDFRDLKVWSKAHQLTLDVYRATAAFPREELFRLTSQMRRCCVSVGANIAEGCGKRLQIAAGSASELDYHLLLAHDLKFLAEPDYQTLATDLLYLRKMLTSLIQKIEHERLISKCYVPNANCQVLTAEYSYGLRFHTTSTTSAPIAGVRLVHII
jgi:four helix bundle protein